MQNKETGQVQKESRISDRCGSNLVVILIPLISILTTIWGEYPLWNFLISLAVGYEIFRLGSKTKIFIPIFFVGRLLQKYIVTEEPNETEVKLAIEVLTTAKEILENNFVINNGL